MSSYVEKLRNNMHTVGFCEVSYTHTKLGGQWITICKVSKDKKSGCFFDSHISKDFDESMELAARGVFNQILDLPCIKSEKCVKKQSLNKKRSCDGACRCVSIYDLHPDTHLDEITRQCKRFGKVECALYNRWKSDERFISVWMRDPRDADIIVTELNGKVLREREMFIVKGHNFEKHGPSRDNTDDLDKFVMPPRKTKKTTKYATKEELDKELDDYMHEKSSGGDELDKKIDEYMVQRNLKI
jgi:hypothetical protein